MVTNLSSGPLKYDVQPNFRSNCATKNPKYHYFQGERELPHLVALFRESQYRYLHISCHGSQTEIFTTNGAMSYARFAQFFSGHLRLRRLVVSACELGNNMFVDLIAASNKGMHSIVAPAQTIQYDHAAAIWSAFYVSMFSERYASMSHSRIVRKLAALRRLFPVDFYFAGYSPKRDLWNHRVIGPKPPARITVGPILKEPKVPGA